MYPMDVRSPCAQSVPGATLEHPCALAHPFVLTTVSDFDLILPQKFDSNMALYILWLLFASRTNRYEIFQ